MLGGCSKENRQFLLTLRSKRASSCRFNVPVVWQVNCNKSLPYAARAKCGKPGESLKTRGDMMQKKRKNIAKEMTITGFVEEFDSIDDGMGILISGDDDENYVVEPTKSGKKLASFLDEKVKVTGLVSKDTDGLKYINVSSFDVFEDTEDYYDRDEDDSFYDDQDLKFDD
jgi:hypothetical protein